MRHRFSTTAATYAMLTLAGGFSFMLPDAITVPTIHAQVAPDSIRLNGVIRDFRRAHPDFDVMPDNGVGHYAANVKTTLGGDGRPVSSVSGGVFYTGEPDPNLVARWKFDEGAGTTVADELARNPGTVVNGATWVGGRAGSALHFDGSNDHVEIANSPEMQIRGDITFAGWFRLDSDFDGTSPDTYVVMEKFQDVNHDFHIALAGLDYNRPEVPKGTMVFKVENGPTSDYYCYVWTNQRTWTGGQWYHFAAVLNSSDTSQNRIFIDGRNDTDAAIAAGVGFLDTDYDAPMRIGGKTIDYNGFATDIYFEGSIDDVMIFGRMVEESDFERPGGMGYKVDAEWRDGANRPLAPHLYNSAGGAGSLEGFTGVACRGLITLTQEAEILPTAGAPVVVSTNKANQAGVISVTKANTRIDGDVFVGPGGNPAFDIREAQGGVITGTKGTLPAEIPFPTIAIPDTGPSLGDRLISSATTLNADLHVDNLSIRNNAVLTIDGDLDIVVEEECTIENSCRIELLPNASLRLYVLGNIANDGFPGELIIENSSQINDLQSNPSIMTIFYLGSEPIVLGNLTRTHASIYAPDVKLTIENGALMWGNYVGKQLQMSNQAKLYVKGAFGDGGLVDACGTLIADAPGTVGASDNGAITSADTFDQWFRDDLGTNISGTHTITLVNDGAGVYEYLDSDFHPIDHEHFGNEGQPHNDYFTYAIGATFDYAECDGQFVAFAGADDMWLFIDDRLVMDVGGVLPGTGQHLSLDRLGLVDGERYRLRLFYAQRQDLVAEFNLRTNIRLIPDPRPTVSGMFD